MIFKVDTPKQKIIVAILVGIIAGIICGYTKLGWEVVLPPRTPLRDAINPPQTVLMQLGFTKDFVTSTYSYSLHNLPYISFIIHFGFSIFFMVLYSIVAEFWPKITLWQGAAYGIVLWVAFHLILMPAMGSVPAPWDQPFAEHFSELFGHIFCFWAAEIFRHDFRRRFTHQADPAD